MDRFQMQELVNVMWAFAHFDMRDQTLFDFFTSELLKREILPEFDAQALSTTAWSYATLNMRDERLMDRLKSQSGLAAAPRGVNPREPDAPRPPVAGIRYGLHKFQPQSLATVAWAFAAIKCADAHFFNLLAHECMRRDFEKYKHQEVRALGCCCGADVALRCR
jgi:hypothetical protein